MPCYRPSSAWVDLATGAYVFSQSSRRDLGARVEVPCRQCIGCRLDHAAANALRCMHEAHGRDACSFLTFTFSDERFPASQAEWEHEATKLVKRIRKAFPHKVRTFGCLELGESTRRPHGHLLLFGADFPRDEPMARGEAGSVVYRSDKLDALWTLGHASVGDLTEESAGYVARYAMKRRSARDALGEFEVVAHPLTGALVQLRPSMPFARSEGLGLDWFAKYGAQAMHQGFIVNSKGAKVAIPDAYKRKAKALFPFAGADAQCAAMEASMATAWNRTPERLAVREEVKRAQVRHLSRGAV